MSSTVSNAANFIQGDVKARIDRWIANYPEDQKQSATMAALRIVQEVNGGHLTTDLMNQIADYLEIPPISVYEVANLLFQL